MTDLHLLVSIVCNNLGMAMSLLLLLLLRRQSDRQAEWIAGVFLGISIFALYATLTVSEVATCLNLANQSWQYLLSARVSFSISAFFPSIILLGWKRSSIFKEGSPIGDGLFRWSLASASLTTGLLWLGPVTLITEWQIDRIVVVNGLLFLALGFRSLLRHKLSAQLRLCMVTTRAFYAVGLLLALATPSHVERPSLAYAALVLVQQLCILAGILGSFIFIARFRFADVFVKWSVRMAGLVGLATLGAIGLALLSGSKAGSVGGYIVLVNAAVLFALIGLAAAAGPIIDACAEHWLLQQTDLKGELEQIGSLMLAIDSERDLVVAIDKRLIDCLQLTMARTMPSDTFPEAVIERLRTFGDVMEPRGMASFSPTSELTSVEMLVPVMVNCGIRYAIAICIGEGRRTLLSGEVQFLRAVAQQFGVRIHNIEAEADSRQQALRESLLRNQLTEAELRALRAQVNPHFLFNSLNTIADLIVTNPTNAERMTLRLASVFRHVLAQTDRQFTTLSEEFDFLRNYLQIEQERFGDRLSVTMSLDPALAHEMIPTLLLQPIVENAMKHGLAPKGGKGLLQISAIRQGTSIELLVCDNGIGYRDRQAYIALSGSSPRPAGVGLTNTEARLQTIYGSRASLNIESAPMEGCRVLISYPLQGNLYALPHHR
jgi:two-component system LytT family sensor kinase